MDVCKYIVTSQHGGTLNSRRATNLFVRLVKGEKRWEALATPRLFSLKIKVAAIRDIPRSCLDPNDFTVINCIVKGHASLLHPSLRLCLCSRFTLLATWTYFDSKDFSPHPIDSVKGHASLLPLAQQKQRKKIKQKRNRFTK
ncbi:hypothetical protein TNCV_2422321 [Trichonephila clavipes]|nr:hypothetical protein TNCV_2422321 [Trichonephila clavipes]